MSAPELNGTAVYVIDDDTLRWSPEDRLNPTDYALTMTAGFKWWPGRRLYVTTWSTAREDHLLRFVETIEHDVSPNDPQKRVHRSRRSGC